MKIYLFIDDHIKLYSKLLLNGTINASNKVLRKNWPSWPVWPEKNPQMSIKVISLGKWSILIPFQKLPKNVEDLGKLIVTKGFEKLPKVQ